MAKIKGQNLRLMLDGACIAASRSCTVHASAQVEDSSTKDTEGVWQENEVTGLSWDASVEALVPNDAVSGREATCSIGDSSLYAYVGNTSYTLLPGQTLVVTGTMDYTNGSPGSYFGMGVATVPPSATRLAHSTTGKAVYTNTGSTDVHVVVYSSYNNDTLQVNIHDARSIGDITVGSVVDVDFAYTGGTKNREENALLLYGEAIVTDLQMQAGNRENVTYTCQLTGKGALQLNEE